MPVVSLITGTDFHLLPIGTLQIEAGVYGLKSRHSYFGTVAVEVLSLSCLSAYGKPQDPEQYVNGRGSYNIGARYMYRLFPTKALALHAVAHPWYSANLGIFSPNLGGRTSFNIAGALSHFEFTVDPTIGRKVLSFGVSMSFNR